MVANEVEVKIGKMLDCLDEDIEHLQKNLLRLNEMRALVIKRDDKALQKLLDRIREESDAYREHESKRQMIRKQLAEALGRGIDRITLSELEKEASIEQRTQLTARKVRLKSLVENFKREYANTIVLVSECARFNKILIKSVFNAGGKAGSTYYSSKGTVREHKEAGKSWLVNCDL